ncbi:hypothetical protein C5167_013239 [Papaver somniferum]|uniref:Uncharacterized protein n=1 Tax=Papaver somniferum TaxID=3469 RepID=A0A4Y7J2V4_PAPSO|nr:hypothetical protein C5167_013239 [Papaver somniferum]
MKGSSSSLVASIMAASSAMVYSTSGDWDVSAYPSSNKGCSSPSKDESSGKSSSSSLEKDQFAPRFDGLRFIETLITAHR